MALNPFFLQGSPGEQRLVQELINEHLREVLENRASSSTQAEILKRWEEVMGTRKSLKFNVAPLLALEALFLKVRF